LKFQLSLQIAQITGEMKKAIGKLANQTEGIENLSEQAIILKTMFVFCYTWCKVGWNFGTWASFFRDVELKLLQFNNDKDFKYLSL
jgi:hypothetical protein